jgi:hypothetical protein
MNGEYGVALQNFFLSGQAVALGMEAVSSAAFGKEI